jgi:uncharacterized DUF497 family protein
MTTRLEFAYNSTKARSNLRKHGVSFAEAETVFLDPFAVTIPDVAHSEDENREITLGYSERSRMLIVVHTEEVDGELRIISARKANAYEKAQYPHA